MNSVISNTLVQKSSFFAIMVFKPLTATIKKLNLVHRTETEEDTVGAKVINKISDRAIRYICNISLQVFSFYFLKQEILYVLSK